MTDPQAVLEARALLARAEQEEHDERRAELVRQLTAVRNEHREAMARYRTLSTQIKRERETRGNAQAKVLAALDALDEHFRERPSVADYLVDDPDVVAWREAHEALERKRDGLILLRDKLPDPDRDLKEACSYEGAYGRIATLEYAEHNLLHALERLELPVPGEVSTHSRLHAADGVK